MPKSDGTMLRRVARTLLAMLTGLLVLGLVVYVASLALTPYSQLARAIAWGDFDIDDWRRFPSRPVRSSLAPSFYALPRDPGRFAAAWDSVDVGNGPETLDSFLKRTGTTAFIVLHEDELLYERYFNGHDRTSIQTSFASAQAWVSTLIGIAIEEGDIGSLDDPITTYVPELAARDLDFAQITLQHLLTMTSGIRYEEKRLPWSDDATTYYAPDLRQAALSVDIAEEPGREFRNNNYNLLLEGLILERATGMSVADYLSEKLWQPLGMEAGGTWSLDSASSGFEKMANGLNAQATDFARLGLLYLNGGRWRGAQLVPAAWIADATAPVVESEHDTAYGYHWWVHPQPGGAVHYSARGERGQIIYVAPDAQVVIVRFGREAGTTPAQWNILLAELAERVAASPR